MSEFNNELLTSWGYMVDATAIGDLITPAEFVAFTGGKFSATDSRITANIPSASASIRNFCGWHISPSLTCGMIYRLADLRDSFIGPDVLIQLPATYVSRIDKVVVDAVLDPDTGDYIGDNITDYDLTPSGLLRIYDIGARDRKSRIFVKYIAGLDDANIAAVKELAANLVTHAVANPYGVNSEAAGGVSVSYNSTWAGHASATGLSNDTREVLEPYKVRGVY